MTALVIVFAVAAFLGLCILSVIESHLARIRCVLTDLADQGRVRAAREAYLDKATAEAQARLERERHA